MTSNHSECDGLVIVGLDGGNPLAFLATLGTLRLLSFGLPDRRVAICWRPERGAWRPNLIVEPAITRDEVLDELSDACRYGALRGRRGEAKELETRFRDASALRDKIESEAEKSLKQHGLSGKRLQEKLREQLAPLEAIVEDAKLRWLQVAAPHLLIGDDLTLDKSIFSGFATSAAQAASRDDRSTADFAAAFGCEATTNEEGRIYDTALRTMAGAGHQHFLGFMRNIVLATTREHIEKALFSPWCYDDPVENLTLRWDPIDDVRYALRWRNPSGDPVRKKRGSVLGANRLAIEGMPLMPTAPQGSYLATTGFRGRKSSETFWTWPIWQPTATLDMVRTLVAHRELQQTSPDRRLLAALGVVELYRSQRITIGKVRNFAPASSFE